MTIENRVELLEKDLKATKRLNHYLVGAILVLFAIGTIGATSVKTFGEIRADKFRLVDEKGTTRAMLSFISGQPSLSLLNENGKIRVLVASGQGLIIADDFGKTRAAMGIDSEAGPGPVFYLADENSLPRIQMGVSSVPNKKGPVMFLSDENGKGIWSAP
jgi:hypothetical protein